MPKELPQIRLDRALARRVKASSKKSGRTFPGEAAYLIKVGLITAGSK